MASDQSQLTLNQAILSSVNAILQAQVHAARSFLNMVLQMGFPHQNIDDDGKNIEHPDQRTDQDQLYRLEFIQEQQTENETIKKYKISIPTIAALPLNPLAIDQAEVDFTMKLSKIYSENPQFSDAQNAVKSTTDKYTASKRPWYLIDDPVTFRGSIGSHSKKGDSSEISVKIKLASVEVPDQLKRFIASAGDFSKVELVEN